MKFCLSGIDSDEPGGLSSGLMDRIATFKNLAASAERGELVFPTSIDAALKIQQAFADPDSHLESVGRLVLTEPMLTARIVAIANSAAYNRNGREITDVRTAINRLGFRTLHALATAVVARQFASLITDADLQAKAQQLWEHTAYVAALARLIAAKVTFLDPETALFAAIVHEVGGFYALAQAQNHPGLFDGQASEWVEHGERPIGRAVLQRLAVPLAVLDAVESHWGGYLSLPPLSLGDTLLLANNLAAVESPLNQGQAGKDEAAPSPLIDHVIGDDTLGHLLEASSAEVASLTAALRF